MPQTIQRPPQYATDAQLIQRLAKVLFKLNQSVTAYHTHFGRDLKLSVEYWQQQANTLHQQMIVEPLNNNNE